MKSFKDETAAFNYNSELNPFVAKALAPPASPAKQQQQQQPQQQQQKKVGPDGKERAVSLGYCDFCLGDANENKKTECPYCPTMFTRTCTYYRHANQLHLVSILCLENPATIP